MLTGTLLISLLFVVGVGSVFVVPSLRRAHLEKHGLLRPARVLSVSRGISTTTRGANRYLGVELEVELFEAGVARRLSCGASVNELHLSQVAAGNWVTLAVDPKRPQTAMLAFFGVPQALQDALPAGTQGVAGQAVPTANPHGKPLTVILLCVVSPLLTLGVVGVLLAPLKKDPDASCPQVLACCERFAAAGEKMSASPLCRRVAEGRKPMGGCDAALRTLKRAAREARLSCPESP